MRYCNNCKRDVPKNETTCTKCGWITVEKVIEKEENEQKDSNKKKRSKTW
jgi:transcription initiation factor TFIIIB Brf1 subunit/transcription initiation factor TFIIB